MRIDIISVMPELIKSPFEHSIIKRARERDLAEIHLHDLKDYSSNKYRRVDDYQYGGGAGMVIQIEPVDKIISKLRTERNYEEIIYTTPDGELYKQAAANELSLKQNLIILCGHYKGIDQRIRDEFITREISVGDYVLTGGEIAAAAIADSIIRLIPGVISDETSALSDSFQDNLLAPPVYTRPADYKGLKVPEILLSGNFPKIEAWRHEKALEKTQLMRPELLNNSENKTQKPTGD